MQVSQDKNTPNAPFLFRGVAGIGVAATMTSPFIGALTYVKSTEKKAVIKQLHLEYHLIKHGGGYESNGIELTDRFHPAKLRNRLIQIRETALKNNGYVHPAQLAYIDQAANKNPARHFLPILKTEQKYLKKIKAVGSYEWFKVINDRKKVAELQNMTKWIKRGKIATVGLAVLALACFVSADYLFKNKNT